MKSHLCGKKKLSKQIGRRRKRGGKRVKMSICELWECSLSLSLSLRTLTHRTHTHSLSLALQLSKWWRLTTLNKFPLWKKPEVTPTRLLEGKNEDKLRLCREPLWKGTPFETKIQLCASARVGELMCKCAHEFLCGYGCLYLNFQIATSCLCITC